MTTQIDQIDRRDLTDVLLRRMNRDGAVARAETYFDSGAFREDLARRVAMPTESQNPDRASTLTEYLETVIPAHLSP